MTQRLNYDALVEFIGQQQLWFEPAELQGLLTALVVFKEEKRLRELLFTEMAPPSELSGRLLAELSQHIRAQLDGGELGYQLLLPEEPLRARAEALLDWIRGFLYIVERLQPPRDEEQQEQLALLRTLLELDTDALAGADGDNEAALQLHQLEEQVRLGIWLFL